MPWKECSVMDERLQFVAELCREFGISRKTGYKIFDRYQECGVQGLTDRSRRPYRYANQLPFQVENYILNVKREHASWGGAQDSRASAPQVLGDSDPGQKHYPCGTGSLWPSRAPRSDTSSCPGHGFIARPASQ